MRKLVIILILGSASLGLAQETGSVYVESQVLPNSDVATIKKNSLGFDYPLKTFSDKESISLIGEFQNMNINFVDEDVPFETGQIENFNTIGLGLAYNRILNNGWGFSLKVTPQLSSNYDTNEFNSEDLFIGGSLIFDKLNEEKQTMWSFGVDYDSQNGLEYPIPVVAYTKRLNDQWAYKIGFPDARIKWTINDNHYFEAFTTLDGFAGNINDDLEIYKEDYTGFLKNTYLVGGLGYNITFFSNFEFNVQAGYSAFNTMEVQDYDADRIYDFDMKNGAYYNFGLKYNLKKKTKVKSPY
ncbi:DUF6268 family outer membrane beta-barrel protein [Maribacter polysaccharolyticus]|uniref:DUF6268 family outer membrane beta-barrel protein n=1 Tax=Maribacter polysaccharolyticus TaxID=3020831 RepID=UPI00237F01B1|nr:DUF6268 family outer membrane beta-barrel protein [Maribacter polysaccharolyticus]MDE3740817.1 DUF6268 family outer membrane beta-barrel protein [Maribacter polysaccharolyticus]